MRALRTVGATSVAVALAFSLSSCGSNTVGTPVAAEIDVRKLETGSYSADPGDVLYRYIPGMYFGRELAAMRLSDSIANGSDIDPSLTYESGAAINDPKDQLNADISAPFISALQTNGMLYGLKMDKRQGEDNRPADGDKAVGITVYQFPDENSAKAAAKAFEDADFSVAKDQNEAVHLDKYPDALSHWRPGIRTIGSRLAAGNYMLDIFARAPKPELQELSSLLQRIYDVQLPLLRNLPPLTKRDILHLPYDPEGMLRRAFAPKGFYGPNLSVSGYFTARAARNFTDPDGKSLLQTGNVDAVATVSGITKLWRSRDTAGAKALYEELRRRVKDPIDPPKGVPDSFCEKNANSYSWSDDRFRCFVRYDRYVARVISAQVLDTQQRAAAQYAVLANSW
ncbi:hypothetical protein IRT45_01175 [Nocardia sp. BSTN01]|uniref:DUF7373 family lipoprotein n=1 Tax=Nocardia sp. BSTN01 TaxID=2783665 RepID=UPI00188EBD1E|nr:hypothetical protein [Nocardia sp. BSTN01]MBF4995764.1 hypothetical protein [Nocardia sp. BSTN01]